MNYKTGNYAAPFALFITGNAYYFNLCNAQLDRNMASTSIGALTDYHTV